MIFMIARSAVVSKDKRDSVLYDVIFDTQDNRKAVITFRTITAACDVANMVRENAIQVSIKGYEQELRDALYAVESYWSDVENTDPTEYRKIRNMVRAALAKYPK